jgi:hypothetical protein
MRQYECEMSSTHGGIYRWMGTNFLKIGFLEFIGAQMLKNN